MIRLKGLYRSAVAFCEAWLVGVLLLQASDVMVCSQHPKIPYDFLSVYVIFKAVFSVLYCHALKKTTTL
jgi:hypothetical protein